MARTPKTEETYSNCNLDNMHDAYMVMTENGDLMECYETRTEAEEAVLKNTNNGEWGDYSYDIYMKVTIFRQSGFVRNP